MTALLIHSDLGDALATIELVHNGANVHRCVAGRFINSLSSTRGSMLADNRYTRKDRFPALYTSHEPYLSILEVTQSPSFQGAFPGAAAVAHITFSVRANMGDVLDLTVEEIRQIIGTNLQELTGDWKRMNLDGLDAPTQILGQAAFDSGRISAIRYPSKIAPDKANLVIFKERIAYQLSPINLPEGFPDQDPL